MVLGCVLLIFLFRSHVAYKFHICHLCLTQQKFIEFVFWLKKLLFAIIAQLSLISLSPVREMGIHSKHFTFEKRKKSHTAFFILQKEGFCWSYEQVVLRHLDLETKPQTKQCIRPQIGYFFLRNELSMLKHFGTKKYDILLKSTYRFGRRQHMWTFKQEHVLLCVKTFIDTTPPFSKSAIFYHKH